MERSSITGSFPSDFLWGVATASYQVEGAAAEGGRTPSIWDTFSHTPGKVRHGHTGDVACDQYHLYEEDIELMKKLGIDAYRFSISWSRLFPHGGCDGSEVNPEGLDYYRSLIETLRRNGIEPVITLYHWDLPQEIEDRGGWPSRETVDRFAEYAARCFRLFPEVRRWITLNEPYCSSILGYLDGEHAPGKKNHQEAMSALHHLLLAHGRAVRAFREGGHEGEIGITLNLQTPRPATRDPQDVLAADRAADLLTRMFLHPLLGKGYPKRYLDAYPELSMPVKNGDMEIISEGIDFLGLNFYFELAVVFDPAASEQFRAARQYQAKTEMGWPITPEGFYRHLIKIAEETGDLPLYVTENGAAFDDQLSHDGLSCHDLQRIDYVRAYVGAARRAMEEGVPLRGYFLWSFVDNFEWAHGYTKRFGLVYCDFVNRRRIPKDSFYFYRDLISGMEKV